MAKKLSLDKILNEFAAGGNIADLVDDETLAKIGNAVVEDFDKDMDSRDGWDTRNEKAIELAMQVKEQKTFPWPNASNIKFPLLTVAVLQFASRIVPQVIKMPYPVSGRVNGYPTDDKVAAADRMGRHMSYQLTDVMDGWMDDMDTLMHVLPITGVAFKKTYQDMEDNRPVSELVMPDRLVFDYYAKSVETARIATHWFYVHPQDALGKQRAGWYRDVELTQSESSEDDNETRNSTNDTDTPEGPQPYKMYEQHRWWDLDGDGYEEPYIVTVEAGSRKVMRISPRFWDDSIKYNDKDQIKKITADSYFTQYEFIKDPSGGNLGIGWGTVLMPINETVNTLINQLVDRGTLNNLGGGFIDKSLKLQGGSTEIQMNEYKKVTGMGQDLRSGIVPHQAVEPSQVLYQLLTLMISWGQRVTAVTDAMTGETPPSNVPATTTLAMLEQGQKVFQGIYSRIFRAFSAELKKIKTLNRLHLEAEEYYEILDTVPDGMDEEQSGTVEAIKKTTAEMGIVYKTDYQTEHSDVTLSAEKQMTSEQVSMARLRLVMEMKNAGINFKQDYVEKLVIRSFGLPDSEKGQVIEPPPPPQPSPQEKMKQMELQYKMQKDQLDAKLEIRRQDIEGKRVMNESQRDTNNNSIKQAELKMKELELELDGMKFDRKTTVDEFNALNNAQSVEESREEE